MAKELIVSVNGREKKIAIIENEQVTEFYIERGEENQGIVGNIYKGRVMRVLPGMQSAFVDIGLERDAFLYVSDFFDEEEEFERIVMDKSKKGDVAEAERAARERIQQARLEREQQIEATHERAEPLIESDVPETGIEVWDQARSTSQTTSRVAGAVIETKLTESSEPAEESGRKRGRRGRRRGKGETDASERPADTISTTSSLLPPEEIETPFATAGSSFQRVVDEDERAAAEDGAMFKDARLQERIFNQIHAVEFEIDGSSTAEVGSLLGSSTAQMDASFQRIDDSDIAATGDTSQPTRTREKVAARVSTFIEDMAQENVIAPSFERVSDDEGGLEQDTETEKRSSSSSSKNLADEATDLDAKPLRTRGGARKSAAKGATKKAAPAKEKPGAKKPAGRSTTKGKKSDQSAIADEGEFDLAVLEDEAERVAQTDVIASEAADSEHFEAGSTSLDVFEDDEASINSTPTRGEFATRRGGRRRRRKPTDKNGDEEQTPGQDEEADVEVEAPAPVVEVIAEPPAPTPPARTPREPREPQRRDRPASQRTSSPRTSGRRETRQQPTITDLLREGQEILVQIAKEPIAKKGARITSHIALPGRFLVYMPTVEHLGVSRKIESDAERVRLRKLIQIIRAEENVPSGGFIVRTAGVGVSEEGLREDARYLVRTWLDIRKSAEKAKAPSMAHQDLDLVQRILRDQLSEDFAAIRVDSEEEYLRIVEFVNRVQPKMVKRVKLHTRDEPILETYGVQAEIDKAIKPRVWLRSGGYLVINQTEALVAIDVNTGKFVGRGGSRLEDTITRTNLEAVDEIVRQIRLRDLGGIIVLDLIDMEDRRNRNRVMQALQEALQGDKSPTKVLSFNDFGLVIMTRKRVKQSLERTLCAPCPYCTGAGLVKSPQTVAYEILEEARILGRKMGDSGATQTTLRVNPEVAKALRSTERDVLAEIEDYLGAVDITSDTRVHQEQFDFAFI